MRRIYCGSWSHLEKSRHLLSSSLHLKKTLKAPSSVTNSPVYLWICCTTYSSGSSHPPADEGMIKRGWRKTASVVSAFMTGTKVALYPCRAYWLCMDGMHLTNTAHTETFDDLCNIPFPSDCVLQCSILITPRPLYACI